VHLLLQYLDELRRVYFTRVSAHIGFVTDIKPVTTTSRQSHEMVVSLGPQGTL
jgi:hypothetical protein